MTLALVIPVRNDHDGLRALIAQAQGFDIFTQIIIVDDGSEQPVVVPPGIHLIRHAQSQGAGVARNTGLASVTCDHVIFFDSDDLFTREFVYLWADLETTAAFDFCLFRYNDSRISALGNWGQMPQDNALWRKAAGHGALWDVAKTAQAALVQTSNYPWNKVYRTSFLNDNDLQFSHHIVHNDISIHWQSFALADKVLASDRIGAHHVVHPTGQRLTNEAGRDRLDVFKPLEMAAKAVANDHLLKQAFLQFTANLLDWVREVLSPDLHADLDAKTGSFWGRYFDEESFKVAVRNDPILAMRLILQMAGGRAKC
jgi:hypothetical protein